MQLCLKAYRKFCGVIVVSQGGDHSECIILLLLLLFSFFFFLWPKKNFLKPPSLVKYNSMLAIPTPAPPTNIIFNLSILCFNLSFNILQQLKDMSSKLKKDPEYSTHQGELEYNRPKNRYKDIVPCKYLFSCFHQFSNVFQF